MAKIIFRNLTKIYKPANILAVDKFNLEINDEEFIVLVGPSGCGKSTTIRMVAGLEEITDGELYIDDILMNNIASKDREIAMVFQNYALLPHLTVFENIAFGLKLRKLPKLEIKDRVNEAAEMLDIQELLYRKPKSLSGGQRQRVALGRAMVRDAKVFLMDEPLSNLDAKLRVQTRMEIVNLHKKLKTTTIYVTHDQTEAMTMGDRIVIMKDGIIQQVDTPKEVYNNPANMFVASFIGTPQMNFIEVHLIEEGIYYALFHNDKIKLDEEKGRLLKDKSYIGKKLILGIRPEDIHYCNGIIDNPNYEKVNVKVDIHEMVGADIYIHLILGNGMGDKVIARVDSKYMGDISEDMEFAFDMSNAHFFDKETGETITK